MALATGDNPITEPGRLGQTRGGRGLGTRRPPLYRYEGQGWPAVGRRRNETKESGCRRSRVPLATYTGGRLSRQTTELCDRAHIRAFARNAASGAAGDSAAAIMERYASHASYVAKVKSAPMRCRERLLLPADAARSVGRRSER